MDEGVRGKGGGLMPNFRNQWVEIFKAGNYGDKGIFTTSDLDKAVKNLSLWQPPAVLGHPKLDDPAMGWVEALKRDGDVLLAKFEKIQPELELAHENGRVKHRSAAFYRDKSDTGPILRHVGFLGAVPPHIKDLAPIKFEEFGDGEVVAIEFTEEEQMLSKEQLKSMQERVAKFFSELFSGDELQPSATFSEEDRRKFIDEAQKPLLAKIDEMGKTFSEEKKKSEEHRLSISGAATKAEVAAFVSRMKAENKWIPAFSEAGQEAVLENLALASTKVTFGEGDKAKEVSLYDLQCKFIEALAPIVPKGAIVDDKKEFSEEAPNVVAVKAREYVDSEKAKGNVVSIADAVDHVSGKK
jgi:hypothetical protein